jgi:hypothetical protein
MMKSSQKHLPQLECAAHGAMSVNEQVSAAERDFRRQWQGTPYALSSAATYCDVVRQAFNRAWLEEIGASDPIRQAWRNNDPQSTIYLCRIGRDLIALDQQHDDQQMARLSGMIERQIKTNLPGTDSYLYELHVATLFDPASGALGKLAQHGSAGYDVGVEFSRNRTMWVSCKRLKASDAEACFRTTAAQLVSEQRAVATLHGHTQYDSLVGLGEELTTGSDTTRILHEWDTLCQRFRTEAQGATYFAPDLFVAITPSAYATTLHAHTPQATIDRASRAQVLAPLPASEHNRIIRRYKEAVESFKDTVPVPSATDIRVVAVDVPETVSVWAVADAIKQRIEQGQDTDISAVLLTRQVPTTMPANEPRHTVAEEYYLIVNMQAAVTLQDFLAGDHLVIRIEGQQLPDEMRLVAAVNGRPVTLPPGYIFTDTQHPTQISSRFGADGRVTIVLPVDLPRVTLDPATLAAPDSEVAFTIL